MLVKLIILIPSVFSMALCAYLLTGLAIYFRALYKSMPASEPARARRHTHIASASPASSVEIEAIPAI